MGQSISYEEAKSQCAGDTKSIYRKKRSEDSRASVKSITVHASSGKTVTPTYFSNVSWKEHLTFALRQSHFE